MLPKLNARWKSPGQILLEARATELGVTLPALLGLAAMSIAAFVIAEPL